MALEIIHSMWSEKQDELPLAVLDLLREFKLADLAVAEQTRQQLHIGDKDLAALRFLLVAADRDEPVSPSALGAHLGITSASTTTLIKRLEAAGYVQREPHPKDRRGQYLRASAAARTAMQPALLSRVDHILQAASEFSERDLQTVKRFLEAMISSIQDGALSQKA
ncbi:hypothetical protein UM93_13085 [Psychromicrobium lacuslunae]|uniref:HTH marR-type domain-containing protein n=2 Tax=Psychromicrobium lacuslunae TaxID=1618207 RepID=A0A0D4C0U0_9MICC|nr:hypothetical protein UM93_13085 [Psychromicrobium lacuslunae]